MENVITYYDHFFPCLEHKKKKVNSSVCVVVVIIIHLNVLLNLIHLNVKYYHAHIGNVSVNEKLKL